MDENNVQKHNGGHPGGLVVENLLRYRSIGFDSGGGTKCRCCLATKPTYQELLSP